MGTIAGLSPWVAVIAIVIAFVGSALQASIGIGLGLVAAPTMTLIDPDFVPGALVIAVVPLTIGMAAREHDDIDGRGLLTAIPGRFVGVILGAVVVANTGTGTIALVVAVSVLIAVLASLTTRRFAPNARNLAIAGAGSGFSGAVAGVGGPPMALTYQHADPGTLRSTLAMFHSIGAIVTIPSLILVGAIGRRQWELAALLVPGVLAGLFAGKYTIGRLPQALVRLAVLVVCAASAIALLVQQLA